MASVKTSAAPAEAQRTPTYRSPAFKGKASNPEDARVVAQMARLEAVLERRTHLRRGLATLAVFIVGVTLVRGYQRKVVR